MNNLLICLPTLRRVICGILAFVFFCMNALPSNAQVGSVMPAPGTIVPLSLPFSQSSLKGLKVYPENPFRFDFILDTGEQGRQPDIQDESARLIRYFLASLTIPEKDLWVNLSPYEKDRIITNEFGMTEMGRDLLEQDYLLKQITASVIYPEGEVGKKFWSRIYQAAFEKFGTTDIPVDTFNKVWITPSDAEVFENQDRAYVIRSHLKVMLESDYLATEKQLEQNNSSGEQGRDLEDRSVLAHTSDISKQILREIVLPELEREVNEGKNFALLRQIYQSLILAAWFKKKVKESLLSRIYVDRKKIVGVNIDDPAMAQKIWAQYVEAFKKGAYNYIKEEQDPLTQEILPRKYFSGGVDYSMLSETSMHVTHDMAQLSSVSKAIVNGLVVISIGLAAGDALADTKGATATKPPVASMQEARKEWQGITYELLRRKTDMYGKLFSKLSREKFNQSLIYSQANQGMLNNVRNYLVEAGVLADQGPMVPFLFLKGLSQKDVLGSDHKNFAMAITESIDSERVAEFVLVSADEFELLGEKDAFEFLVVKYAHEGTHVDDFRRIPNPTAGEKMASEARAYKNTILAMEKMQQAGLASYSQEQLNAQHIVAKAFEIWLSQKEKIANFDNLYYTNISLISITSPVVVLDLIDESTGKLSQVKINTNKEEILFKRVNTRRELERGRFKADFAQITPPDLGKRLFTISDHTPLGLVPLYGRSAAIADFNRMTDEFGRSYVLVYRGLKNVGKESVVGKAHQSLAARNNFSRGSAYKLFAGSIIEAVLHNVANRGAENDATLHTTLNPEMAKLAARIGNGVVVTFRIPEDWLKDNRPVIAQKGDVEEEVAFYYDLPAEFVYKVENVSEFSGSVSILSGGDARQASSLALNSNVTKTAIMLPKDELVVTKHENMRSVSEIWLDRAYNKLFEKARVRGNEFLQRFFARRIANLPSERYLSIADSNFMASVRTSLPVSPKIVYAGIRNDLTLPFVSMGAQEVIGVDPVEESRPLEYVNSIVLSIYKMGGAGVSVAGDWQKDGRLDIDFKLNGSDRKLVLLKQNIEDYYFGSSVFDIFLARAVPVDLSGIWDKIKAGLTSKGVAFLTEGFEADLTGFDVVANLDFDGIDKVVRRNASTETDIDQAQKTPEVEGVELGMASETENLTAIIDGIEKVDREARFKNNPGFGRNHRLSRETIEAILNDHESRVYWARKDGQVIGYAIIRQIGADAPHLSRIASLPDAPGGLGSVMLDRLINDLRLAGKKTVTFIPFSRTKSLEFFRKYADRSRGQIKLVNLSSIAWKLDFAMNTAVNGGIDLNTDRLDLQVKNAGNAVRFQVDPEVLRRFESLSGLSPVFIDIKPLDSIQTFLGFSKN